MSSSFDDVNLQKLVHFPNYQRNISEGTYDLRLVVVTKRLLDGEFVLESEYLNGLKY